MKGVDAVAFEFLVLSIVRERVPVRRWRVKVERSLNLVIPSGVELLLFLETEVDACEATRGDPGVIDEMRGGIGVDGK